MRNHFRCHYFRGFAQRLLVAMNVSDIFTQMNSKFIHHNLRCSLHPYASVYNICITRIHECCMLNVEYLLHYCIHPENNIFQKPSLMNGNLRNQFTCFVFRILCTGVRCTCTLAFSAIFFSCKYTLLWLQRQPHPL